MIERKNRRSFYKVLFYTIALASFIGFVIFVSALIRAIYTENASLRDKLALRELELSQLHKEIVDKREYLDHFMRDDEFKYRVARDRLGYLGPNEFIFEFEDEDRR